MKEFTVNTTKDVNGFNYYTQCNNCYENISETKKITDMWMESHECSMHKLNEKEHDKKCLCIDCCNSLLGVK